MLSWIVVFWLAVSSVSARFLRLGSSCWFPLQESWILPELRWKKDGGHGGTWWTESFPTCRSGNGCSPCPMACARLAYDAGMLGKVLRIFSQAVRRTARESGIPKGQCGAVTLVQRFGSALNLHVHAHMLVLDGVYAALEGEAPRFYPLHTPDRRDVEEVAERIAARTAALMEQPNEAAGDRGQDRLWQKQLWLSGLYTSSVGTTSLRWAM